MGREAVEEEGAPPLGPFERRDDGEAIGLSPGDVVGKPLSSTLQMMCLGEVATCLAVSVELVEELVGSGELPAIRFGSVARVLVDDLVAFVEAHRSSGPNTQGGDG